MRNFINILDGQDKALSRCEHWSGSYTNQSRQAYRGPLSCWILRILTGAGDMPAYVESGNPKLTQIADLVGVPALKSPESSAKQIGAALEQALRSLVTLTQNPTQDPTQAKRTPGAQDCPMLSVVDWLASSAGLNATERAIFEFGVGLRIFSALRTVLLTWGPLNHGELMQGLSAVLDLPGEAVSLALQSDSTLLRCGLIRVNFHEGTLDDLLKVPRELSQRIPYHRGAAPLILAHLVTPMAQSTLSLDDFSFMQMDTRLAQCWLVGCLGAAERGERAGHLLVSGAPGLGKTEWVRALLVHAQTQAMELGVLQSDGSALSGEERLSHLRLAMSLLRHTARGILVFDEADDVFRSAGESADADKEAVSMLNHRASLNRLIEESGVPVIWIMNHPEVLDAAVLRRFDVVIAFERTPRSVRQLLLGKQSHWQEADVKTWAAIPSLTPALIDRLAGVQERSSQAGQPMDAQLCAHWLRRRLPGKDTRHLGLSQTPLWRAQAVNASEDLLALGEGIKRCGSARILLFGAAGAHENGVSLN